MRRNFECLDPVAFVALGEELLTYRLGARRARRARGGRRRCWSASTTTGLRGASDELAATIPGAVLVVIPDAGHSPQVEQPELWLDAVEAHLARRR